MVENNYLLKQVFFPDHMQEIGRLRIQAWRDEPGINTTFFSRNAWIESIDHLAYHWVVMKNNLVVAAARMSIHTSLDDVPYANLLPDALRPQFSQRRIASINRLVVDPLFRGTGLARMLDQARLDMARRVGADVVLAQPQLTRLSALLKLGFSYVCELPRIPEMPERPLFFMELNVNELSAQSTDALNGMDV